MSLIPVPAAFKAGRIVWRLIRPTQINRSAYTGRRQVIGNPWHGRWEADVDLVELEAADAAAIRAFIAALDGPVNTFRFPAVSESQSSRAVTVNGSHAVGAQALSTVGWLPSQIALKAGQYFTLNDQLCVLTADAVANGLGVAVLNFRSKLREAAANGTSVVVDIPTALVALKEDISEWTAEAGPAYTFSFKVEEVF